MRYLILSLCLLANCWSFSQTNTTKKPIAPSELGNWVTQKISADDIAKLLGTSTNETITPNETIWEYKYNEDIYTFLFNKDRNLTNASFLDQSPLSVTNLSYEKVKDGKTIDSKEEILAAFGQPHQLTANGNHETWSYYLADKDGHKGLLVDFDPANPGQLRHYSYDEEINHETALTSAVPASLKVGTSTMNEVEKLLGKPSKLTMESQGQERWYYRSQNSLLAVFFDKQSKLSDFSFQRSAN